MIQAPNLDFPWLEHGFGLRDSVPPPSLTTVRQIHSAQVIDACGRRGVLIGDGDAIISAEPGIAIGIRTADCVPILIADSRTRAIACVHAGWRGTAANISAATVDQLKAHGSRPEDLSVAIGPSIGFCCYEVSPDVAQRFGHWQKNVENEPNPSLDLRAINEIQLRNAGVRQIWKSGECTYCSPQRFFSFRREKENAGRMLSFVNRTA